MKQTAIKVSLALIFGVCAMAAQAATLNTGDRLTINSGAAITAIDANGNPVVTGFTGSWFGVNINFNGMGGTGKAPLSQGTDGVIIGMAQPYGSIDAPWMWQGFIGGHYTTNGITGGTATGLDMSGWNVNYNGAPIPLNGDAWGAGFTNRAANFVWDGVYGDAYTLDYHAILPITDPSCFCYDTYALHLEGKVNAVPLPAAAWLLGSGLLGLMGVASRQKSRRQV